MSGELTDMQIGASIRPLCFEAWSHPKRVAEKEKTREPLMRQGWSKAPSLRHGIPRLERNCDAG
jgi:hypothetical protein